MATLTWIGGGNDKASNPQDWSPVGTPESGDTLQVGLPGGYTMNVRGDDLAGNTLVISASVTLNLSHDAAVTAEVNPNLSDAPSVDLTANLARGVSTLNISQALVETSVDVNLARDATWVGSFDLFRDFQPLMTTAGKHALFINEGNSVLMDSAGGVLAMRVAGSGTIGVTNSNLEFKSSVGAGLSVFVTSDAAAAAGGNFSTLTIDHPKAYHADTSIGMGAEIDLVGLAHADSYSLNNDLLKIYSGDTVIDTMRLSDANLGSETFAVVQAADGVHLLTLEPLTPPPSGLLPLHCGV